MGCSLRESILGLDPDETMTRAGKELLPVFSRLMLRRVGGRGPGRAGGRGGSRAGQAWFGRVACRQRGVVVRQCVTHPTPALPRPWPVGRVELTLTRPLAPPFKLSNSQAATRLPLLLRISSTTTSPACAWLATL